MAAISARTLGCSDLAEMPPSASRMRRAAGSPAADGKGGGPEGPALPTFKDMVAMGMKASVASSSAIALSAHTHALRFKALGLAQRCACGSVLSRLQIEHWRIVCACRVACLSVFRLCLPAAEA
eukprot:11186775-Lingulodinium_polyedra.AAC.1